MPGRTSSLCAGTELGLTSGQAQNHRAAGSASTVRWGLLSANWHVQKRTAAESALSGGFGFTDNWELPATWLSYAQGSVSFHSGPQPQHRHIVSHVTDTREKYELHKLTEDVTVHTCACMLSCKHNQHVSCMLANLSFENSIIA